MAKTEAGSGPGANLNRNLSLLILLGAGFLIGILWLASMRFLLARPQTIHYHADFAVYVDGVREEFKSFTYYEEVAACTSGYGNSPRGRTHMHDSVNSVIHVHDRRVTYADFFNNIDWTLGPDFVRDDQGLITDTADKKWAFILNGERVRRVDNTIIGDQDKLLLSYGPDTTDFQSQYDSIESKAGEMDAKQDPSSCSGLNGPADNSFGARLKRAFWFSE